MSTTHPDSKQPLADEPRLEERLVRWIPIVVPLLALFMVLGVYFIAWGVLERV